MEHRRTFLKKAGTVGAIGISGLAGCGQQSGGDQSGGGGDTTTTTESSGGGGGDTTTSTESSSGGSEEVNVAYVYNEAVSNLGWVHTHEVARKALEEKYDWYNTRVVESISVSKAANTFESLANQGFDAIEAATYGYGEPGAKVVKDHDIYIESARLAPVSGYSGPRMGYYMGKMDQPSYVVGKAAGMLTESNTLGFIMAFPTPDLLTEVNAVTLGAQTVNPDITMKVRYTNTWYDPPKERQAAQSLIDEGVDVLGYHVSSPTCLKVAADQGIWGYGYADGFAGTSIEYDKYLTSRMWNWVPFFESTAKAAKNGNLGAKSTFNVDAIRANYFGFDKGGVQMDDYGANVPSDAKSTMQDTAKKFTSGDLTGDDIFKGTKWESWGPYERASKMAEYTDGIEGSVPS